MVLDRHGGGAASQRTIAIALALTCVLAVTAAFPVAYSTPEARLAAWAAEVDAEAGAEADEPPDYESLSLKELKRAVSDKEAERDDMQAQIDGLVGRAEKTRAELEQLDGILPAKQEQAQRSVSERYKVQRQYGSLIEVLLYTEDWRSFTTGIEYIARASRAHIEEFVALREERAACERTISDLDAQRAELDSSLGKLREELEEMTKVRDEKQRKADLVANTHLVPDGADWKAGKKAFVKEWGPRLDAYLEGSPLEGQGDTFAKAAWDNHIDPRFSAAISSIESGKGSICIRPHNAWGWGAADPNPAGLASSWDSWEDAINAHARGLAAGYGYSPTPRGAQKYCPPNWEEWYAHVVNGMNGI